MKFKYAILALAVATGITLNAQTPAPKADAKTSTPAKKEVAPPPTAAQIADAKAKGMVWVNLNSKVYHKEGDFYGNTKNGKFMTEDDAKKAGYKLAQEPAPKKAKTPKTDAKAPATK
jgi:hypothetical protein